MVVILQVTVIDPADVEGLKTALDKNKVITFEVNDHVASASYFASFTDFLFFSSICVLKSIPDQNGNIPVSGYTVIHRVSNQSISSMC